MRSTASCNRTAYPRLTKNVRSSLNFYNSRNVSDATYARVKAVLGERGILDVVAVLGYYSLIAMSMKAFALRPDGGSNPFAE